MSNYLNQKEFDYEDVIKAIKEIFKNENIKNIYDELGLPLDTIIKNADDNLIDAIEGERLIEYTARYLTFILVVNVCKKFVEEAKQKIMKDRKYQAYLNNEDEDEVEEPEEFFLKDTEYLQEISAAYIEGDYNQIIDCIVREHIIPKELGENSVGEIKILESNEARFLAFIRSYEEDFNNEIEKLFIKNKLSKEEVFNHTKVFYKNNIATSKKLNQEYIEKHPEDPKAFLIFKKDEVSLEDFFEAARFYNKINSHIIAVLDKGKIKIQVKDYDNAMELMEAYKKMQEELE